MSFDFLTLLDGISVDSFLSLIGNDFVKPIAGYVTNIGGYCCLILGIVQVARYFTMRHPAPPMQLVMMLATLCVGGVCIAGSAFTDGGVTGMTGWANMVKNTFKDMANTGGDIAGPVGVGWWSGGTPGTNHHTPNNQFPYYETPPGPMPNRTSNTLTDPNYTDPQGHARSVIMTQLSNSSDASLYWQSVYDSVYGPEFQELYNEWLSTHPSQYMSVEEYREQMLERYVNENSASIQRAFIEEGSQRAAEAYSAYIKSHFGYDLSNPADRQAYEAMARNEMNNPNSEYASLWTNDSAMRDAYRESRAQGLEAVVDAKFSAESGNVEKTARDPVQIGIDENGHPIYSDVEKFDYSYTYTDASGHEKTISGKNMTAEQIDAAVKAAIKSDISADYNRETTAALSNGSYANTPGLEDIAKENALNSLVQQMYNADLSEVKAAAAVERDAIVKQYQDTAYDTALQRLSTDPAYADVWAQINAEVDQMANNTYASAKAEYENNREKNATAAAQNGADAMAKTEANAALNLQLQAAVSHIMNSDSLLNNEDGSSAGSMHDIIAATDGNAAEIDNILRNWAIATQGEWDSLFQN